MDNATLKIWNEMNQQLFNFVNQKVKDSELSKDIVQDVFIKVFSKLDTLKNKDKLVSWIFQITRNEIISHFRKHQHKSSLENIPQLEMTTQDDTFEFSKCISHMITALPEKYREAIQLSEIENISQKVIAEKLNISYSGAKSRVQRGREQLKQLLQKCCAISTDHYGNVIDYKVKNCSEACD